MSIRLCVTVFLCLVLVTCIDSGVMKPAAKQKTDKIEVALPPEGLTMDLLVRNRGTHQALAKVKIDINEQNKKVVLSLMPEPPPDIVPSIDDRNGIVVGTCPVGYTRSGGFCFKDDDDY